MWIRNVSPHPIGGSDGHVIAPLGFHRLPDEEAIDLIERQAALEVPDADVPQDALDAQVKADELAAEEAARAEAQEAATGRPAQAEEGKGSTSRPRGRRQAKETT